jgi:hypothetical protein
MQAPPSAWSCAQAVGVLAAIQADPRRILQLGAHMQIARFHNSRLVAAEDAGVILLDLGELCERVVFGK